MSVRLNVVVVQSPRMTNLQVGIVAEIVIQLLGRPGIDLAIVKSLESDEEHSTDRLMLSSLENDLAVIDWRSAEQTLASLATLGGVVCRAPFALDPDVPTVAPGRRRVYIVDLRNAFQPVEVVEALMSLLKQRQVVTVSLAGLKPAVSKIPANSTPPKPEPAAAITNDIAVVVPSGIQGTSSRSLEKQFESQPYLAGDAALDALVDDLNDIDL